MLRDPRTWKTLACFVLMLPLGIACFVIAGLRLLGLDLPGGIRVNDVGGGGFVHGPVDLLLAALLGALLLTLLMHLARAIGRGHARLAKALLVPA